MKLHQLSKSYDGQIVFSDLSLVLSPGKRYALLGENGVGKTTLLNIINGNLAYDSGQVEMPDDQVMVEEGQLPFEFMTGQEFIKWTSRFKNKLFDRQLQDHLCQQLELTMLAQPIKVYSKGTLSKLKLVIALLSKPDLLVLDEPFADLDVRSFEMVKNLIKASGQTVIFSTHQARIAHKLADEIILMTRQCLQLLPNHFSTSESLEAMMREALN